MATQLLFYSNAVPVTPQKHAGMYVKTGRDFGFARSVNSVPVTAVEFRRATPEYAVVFAGDGESVMPVAILGAAAGQNAFIKDDGSWDARYIPAFVRRYPFVFSSTDAGRNFTLCLDDAFSGCNREGRGERLFDADGARTQYMETVLSFLKEYQIQFQRTRAFCAHLKELNLLEPMRAQFTLPNGQRRSLTGFMAVNRARLKELGDDVLARMAKSDELELIYLHLQSMQNLSAMLGRVGARAEADAAGLPPEKPESDGAPSLPATEPKRRAPVASKKG